MPWSLVRYADTPAGTTTTTAVAVVVAVAVASAAFMTPTGNHGPTSDATDLSAPTPLRGRSPCGATERAPTRVGSMPHGDAARALEMAEPTGRGRLHRTRRRVRLGDVTPGGRLRLDAAVRYLQDIANDDARDAGTGGADLHGWVVRRTVVDATRFPAYLDEVDLVTWCAGVGACWAERRTRMSDVHGAVLLDASALWVHVDLETIAPRRLSPEVAALWGEASGGRRVRSRLVLDPVPIDSLAPVATEKWTMRRSDFDALGHLNNAAAWEIVEERLAVRRDLRGGSRYVVEHIGPVEPGEQVTWSVHANGDGDGESIRVRVGDEVRLMFWMGPAPA